MTRELLAVIAKRYRVRAFVLGRLRRPLERELCGLCAIVPKAKCRTCWYRCRARVFLARSVELHAYEQRARWEEDR